MASRWRHRTRLQQQHACRKCLARKCLSPDGAPSRPCVADFSTYQLLRHWLPGGPPDPGRAAQPRGLLAAVADAASAVVCGGLAGMVMWCVVLPLDTAKTRIQTAHPGSAHDVGVLRQLRMLQREGERAGGRRPPRRGEAGQLAGCVLLPDYVVVAAPALARAVTRVSPRRHPPVACRRPGRAVLGADSYPGARLPRQRGTMAGLGAVHAAGAAVGGRRLSAGRSALPLA